jgi:hypothetical protein
MLTTTRRELQKRVAEATDLIGDYDGPEANSTARSPSSPPPPALIDYIRTIGATPTGEPETSEPATATSEQENAQ